MSAQLSPDEAAAVLHRAAELDTSPLSSQDALDEEVVRAAAREVGLSEAAVSQAVQEWRTGALAPLPALPENRWAGLSATTAAERRLAVPPERAARAAEDWLRGQWFERRRVSGFESTWAPRTGMFAGARRALDVQHRLRLSGVHRVRLCVAPAADGVRVRLMADLGPGRAGLLVGWVAGPALAVGAGVGVLLALPGDALPEVLLAVPAAAAAGGGGWAVAKAVMDRRLGQVREEFERVLDELSLPVSARPGLSQRLAGLLPHPHSR